MELNLTEKWSILVCMFEPKEIIFALTGKCNLQCSHCTVGRSENSFNAEQAQQLILQCRDNGIERIGFSGGEPFLEKELLVKLIKEARNQDLLFDRIMTNGVWFIDEVDLKQTLDMVYDAGFDGTIGLSYDGYHQQPVDKVSMFIKAVHEISGSRESVELVCVYESDYLENAELFAHLAAALGCEYETDSLGIPYRLTDRQRKAQEDSGALYGSGLMIPITHIGLSRTAEAMAWKDTEWFTDDFCEGPGQVLYVHPDGSIAACCGFANENSQLNIGSIGMELARLLENAKTKPYIRWCYEKGLGNLRQKLELEGHRFPGKTRDMCGFCNFVCRKKLEELVGPPGLEPGTNGL